MKHLKIIGIGTGIILTVVVVGFFVIHKKAVLSQSVIPLQLASPSDSPLVAGAPEKTLQVTSDISKIPILTYHSFGPKPITKETSMQAHYRVTPENFEAQMKYLAEKNYQTITFADLIESQVLGKPIPENAIVLTFDDGWKSQYDYAVPILEKYKFTGTFFIITGAIGATSYMTVDELKTLHTKGFEIASHTVSHPKLPTLEDAQLVQEIQASKKTLEDKLGIIVTTLAYPYYAHDVRVMQAVRDAGYLGARAGWGGFKNNTEHLFELKSQEVVNNPNPFSDKRVDQ